MKKKSLKIQDFKAKLSNAQIINGKSLNKAKGGMSDPPPFGHQENQYKLLVEC